VITTLHTVLSDPDPARKKVIQLLSERSKILVTMTRDSARLLQKVYDIPRNKITVIPHGAPKVSKRSRTRVLRKLGLEPGYFYLVITGLMSPNKGVDLVIRALPDILKKHPNVKLLVVGQTHPSFLQYASEAYRKGLVNLSKKLSVDKAITYVTNIFRLRH
jgi:polysaccharide biosynthesis protein PslF